MQLLQITIELLGQLNYVAVLAATVVAFVVGFLWYGPLFGTSWIKAMGMSKADATGAPKNKMIAAYILTFVGTFVEVTALLFFTLLLQTQFWHAAILIWVGFIAFDAMHPVFWQNKPWKLFVITAGHRLVSLLVAGLVLSFFF